MNIFLVRLTDGQVKIIKIYIFRLSNIFGF